MVERIFKAEVSIDEVYRRDYITSIPLKPGSILRASERIEQISDQILLTVVVEE